ncbi:MAG TPA: Xaa-Pro peptidase family protein [Candidatus Sulfobium mesophilum]|nr:Xaa-Pro peptidase family protein [Candidatus Sulfobium mesophilum]
MNRIAKTSDALQKKGIDGIIITDLKNIRYLSGFTGSSACLLLTRKHRFFFTDFRYQEQSAKEVGGFYIFIEKEERPRLVLEKAKSLGIRTLGFESTASYAFYKSLLRKGLRVRAITNFVEDMRRVKDRAELDLIEKAVIRAEKAFSQIRPYIRAGVKEVQLASRLEEALKKNGCSALPFDIIVAAGANSSMPHARPGDNKVRAGDLIVIDWGGEAGGYYSDMTRTFLVKGANLGKKREIYMTVLKANLAGIGAVKEGVAARMVDRAARDEIKSAGYGDFFGHGTGHGVGLNVHELPRISRLGQESIKAGMVFTVEPGIYLPGLGGVRIEDMVVASSRNCRVLTRLPKELDIL